MSWRRPPKPLSLPPAPKDCKRRPEFPVGALVNTRYEVTVSESFGDSDKYPVYVYRVIEVVPKPSGWFFNCRLENVQTGKVSEEWYGEEKLIPLREQRVEEGHRGGGESSSKGGNEWDAKTLVGGDEGVGSRDDETLYGDDV